jgi:hypothetical protein
VHFSVPVDMRGRGAETVYRGDTRARVTATSVARWLPAGHGLVHPLAVPGGDE